MNSRFFIFLSFAVTFCSSCAVGPDFVSPVPPSTPTFVGTTCETGNACSPLDPTTLSVWWETFDDPALTELINAALSEGMDVQAAKARILQARARRAQAVSGLLPTIDLSADYRRSRSQSGQLSTGVVAGETNDTVVTHRSGARDEFQAGVSSSWEIDLFGGNRRAVEAAEADLQAAEEDARDVRIVLAAEVASAYFDLRKLDEQMALSKQNVEALRSIADLTERKRAAGLVNGLDESSAKAQLYTSSADLPRLAGERQAAAYELALLLGKEPAALLEQLREPKALPAVPQPAGPGVPADLVSRRPDIRRAAAQVHAQTALIGAAESDFYPKLSLSGLLTWEGATFASVAEGRSSIWSFGPALQWPLFDGGRIAANVAFENAATFEALVQYQLTVLRALNEVERALSTYQQEKERVAALSAAAAESAKAVDIANRLYRAGLTDFINVLTAERTSFSAQQALLDSRRNGLQSVTDLYKALGGGWESQWR
ncbi:MAG: efflux transporter outer membrane subunit [Bdellovibrionota bacterium]